jgi:glyoxylase-like metal-dependent hydrolase (beta-lactamase superfamily II)
MIINTHSNADHAGGNSFIQQKTGCRIAATRLEAAFIENPLLEPAFLFGGFPHSGIRNKFLMAQPSKVTDIFTAGEKLPDTDLETFPLPGHFFDMAGIRTPDNVVFLADSLFSEHIVNKYSVFYLLDIEKHLETLDMLETLEADYYLPSHSVLSENIRALIRINREKILEICGEVVGLCAPEKGTDDIVAGLCESTVSSLTTTICPSWKHCQSLSFISVRLRQNRQILQGRKVFLESSLRDFAVL